MPDLQRAFLEVMLEKGFSASSIQDITEQATVNRGVFYVHFGDKYALLDSIMHEQFQRELAKKLSPASRWERKTLLILIQTIYDWFSMFHSPAILMLILSEP